MKRLGSYCFEGNTHILSGEINLGTITQSRDYIPPTRCVFIGCRLPSRVITGHVATGLILFGIERSYFVRQDKARNEDVGLG